MRLCLIAAKPTDSLIQGFLPAVERAVAATRAAEGSAATGSRS